MKKLTHRLLLSLGSILFSLPALHAATLTISPSIISNDFQGKIVLTVSGLTNGTALMMEKFADVNTNGVIDASDVLQRKFSVTDGELPLIGGVRNKNVPGDDDGSANGQIVTKLYFPGIDGVLGNFTGDYLFRVSYATSGSPIATALLRVVQKPQPQGVTGRITSAATGLPLGNTLVALVVNQGNTGTGTLTDPNGYFTFYSAPGNFMVVPVRDGYLANFGAGQASVLANQFATVNVAMTVGTLTVSGRLMDGASGAGLPGVWMDAQTSDGVFSGGFTDSNGRYSAKLAPGQWKLSISGSALAEMGYVGFNNDLVTNLTTSISNFNVGLPKAEALIYGTIRNGSGAPVSGISVWANDDTGYGVEGISYPTNANYCLGVVAGNWWVGPDSDTAAAAGYSTGGSTNVTIAAGQAIQADFVLKSATAHLIGRVIDNTGAPLGNVGFGANDWSQNAQVWSSTDPDGYFDLGVFAGNWELQISSEDAQANSVIGPRWPAITVVDGVNQSNIVYVAQRATAHITGFVRDAVGHPIPGVGVYGEATKNGTNYSVYTQTLGNGSYSVLVLNATWLLNVSCTGNQGVMPQGYDCLNNQSVTVSGANRVLNFTAPALQVTTGWLPDGMMGSDYNTQVQAYGGQRPYTWMLQVGSLLPPGLTLSSDGFISGIPTTAGTFDFVVQVSAANSEVTEQQLSLTVQSNTPEQPRLDPIGLLLNGNFLLSIDAPAPMTITLQQTDDFSGWSEVLTTSIPAGISFLQAPGALGHPCRFYRVQVR